MIRPRRSSTPAPEVAVIIPAFNSARDLPRALESVLGQTLPAQEIIVVDDESTDDTRTAIEPYLDRVTFIEQQNAGAGAARNAGIAASSSEWIAFLDADDEWLPDKLARQWELMERHPALDWCCAAFFMEKGRGDPRTMVGRPRSGEYDFFDAENAGDFHVSTVTVLVRRSALRAAGGFDAELRRHQDWDMWWRLAYSSPKIGYVGQPLTIVHQDEDTDASMTKRLTAKKGRYLKLLLKKHARLSASTRQRAAFETLALELIRNAVLMAVFLGYKREARQLLEELDDLIPRLPGALLRSIVLTPLSERILRTGYAALQKAGLAETANRNWDYLRLANEERRRELTK